jgi:hypothetical protein
VVVQATTRTIAGVGIGALGVTVGTAGGVGCNETFVGAQSSAVAVVLHNALGPCVTTESSRGLIVDLAGAIAVAGVLCRAHGRLGSAGRISGYKAVVGTRTQPVTQILHNALGPVVTAGSLRGLIVDLACT